MLDLIAYRNSRGKLSETPARLRQQRGARVYVDLDSQGHLSYGLSAANHDNALFLLEPTMYLLSQLIRLATEEETD